MGIDATLYVQPKTRQTESEILKLSYRLYGAYYGTPFYLPGEGHILRPLKNNTIVQDGPDLKLGSQVLEVALISRFYGTGYERGDIPTICSICDWLEFNLPGCHIFYGGDSSGRCAEQFNKEDRENLLRYFYEHGHNPYQKAFNRSENTPTCSRCQTAMDNRGGGDNLTFWACSGCDEHAVGTNPHNPERRERGQSDFFKLAAELRGEK